MDLSKISEAAFMCDGNNEITDSTGTTAADLIEAYGFQDKTFPSIWKQDGWEIVQISKTGYALNPNFFVITKVLQHSTPKPLQTSGILRFWR